MCSLDLTAAFVVNHLPELPVTTRILYVVGCQGQCQGLLDYQKTFGRVALFSLKLTNKQLLQEEEHSDVACVLYFISQYESYVYMPWC